MRTAVAASTIRKTGRLAGAELYHRVIVVRFSCTLTHLGKYGCPCLLTSGKGIAKILCRMAVSPAAKIGRRHNMAEAEFTTYYDFR